MPQPNREYLRAAALGDEISQGFVSDLYRRYVGLVSELHPDVESQTSAVEARFFYNHELLCRVVPYRELFHVQIGENNAWETRIRNEAGFVEAVDRTIQRFLHVYASPPA